MLGGVKVIFEEPGIGEGVEVYITPDGLAVLESVFVLNVLLVRVLLWLILIIC